MSKNVALSRKLNISKDLTGKFRKILDEYDKTIDNMMPAKVLSYDRSKNRAKLKIMISKTRTDGSFEENSIISSVPVYQPGSGGFIISFPVNEGDTGWLKSNDRDITNFLSNLSESSQQTFRKKSFSDSIFFPDNIDISNNIIDQNLNNLVIQKKDGSVRISISDTDINISADNSYEMNCQNGTINSDLITFNSNVKINGNIIINGSIQTEDGVFIVNDGKIILGGEIPVARQGDSTSDGANIIEGSSIVSVG